MPAELVARSAVRYHRFKTATRQISLRNTGVNTLWLSFDRTSWFDVACGTSWDDRVTAQGLWFCTQLGRTTFVVCAVALNAIVLNAPPPTPDELEP